MSLFLKAGAVTTGLVCLTFLSAAFCMMMGVPPSTKLLGYFLALPLLGFTSMAGCLIYDVFNKGDRY
jgi:hypothetical protein